MFITPVQLRRSRLWAFAVSNTFTWITWSLTFFYTCLSIACGAGRSATGKQILRPKTLQSLWQDSLVEYGRKDIGWTCHWHLQHHARCPGHWKHGKTVAMATVADMPSVQDPRCLFYQETLWKIWVLDHQLLFSFNDIFQKCFEFCSVDEVECWNCLWTVQAPQRKVLSPVE